MAIWTILSWVMSIIALAGTVLNAERNIYGFWLWIVSNMYMTIRFAYIGEDAQACLFFIYTLLAIRGLIAWRSKERQARGYHRMSEEETRQALENLKLRLEELNEENKK